MPSKKILTVVAALTLVTTAWGLRALASPSSELPVPQAARSTSVQIPKTPTGVKAEELFVGLGVAMQMEPTLAARPYFRQLWDYAELELVSVVHWQNLHEPFFPQFGLWGNDDGSVYDTKGKVVPAKFPWKNAFVAQRMAPYYVLLGHAAQRKQKILLNNVAAAYPGWMGDGFGLSGRVKNKNCLPTTKLQTEYNRLLGLGLSPDLARDQIQRTLFGGINDHPCYTKEEGDEFGENIGELVRHLVKDEGRFGQIQKRKIPVHALSIWLEPKRTYEVYPDVPSRRPDSHYPKKFVTLFAAVDKYLQRIGLRSQVRLAAGSDHDLYWKLMIRQITDPVTVRSTDIVDLHHYASPGIKLSFIDQINAKTSKPLYMFEAGGHNSLWKAPYPLTPEEIFLWSLEGVRVVPEGLSRGVKAICWYFWANRGDNPNQQAMQAINLDTLALQRPYYPYSLASKTILGDSTILKPTISDTFKGTFSAIGLRKNKTFTVLMVNRGPATSVTLRFADSLGTARFHVYAVSAVNHDRISDLGTVVPQGSSLGVINMPADSVVSVTTLTINQLVAPAAPATMHAANQPVTLTAPDISWLPLLVLVLLGLGSVALPGRGARA